MKELKEFDLNIFRDMRYIKGRIDVLLGWC